MAGELKIKLSAETLSAVQAAQQAGAKIREIYQGNFSSALKQDKEPITEADTLSNNIIEDQLSVFGYPILSEESPDNQERLRSRKIWIIDPLDGTSDFIKKNGEFSVMIALIEAGRPLAGIVYRPTTETIYLAEKDRGAYQIKNNAWTRLSVSPVRELGRSTAVTSRSHLSDEERQFLKNLNISDQYQFGSSGLKIVEVARGRCEFYLTTTNKIKHWDTAAGSLIVKEAGGRITDLDGREIVYNTPAVVHQAGIVASNGKIHEQILNNYRNFRYEATK